MFFMYINLSLMILKRQDMNVQVSILFLCFGLVAVNARNLEPRIMGGQHAQPNEFPYQGALIMDGKFRCGATLISRSHTLTTASCVADFVQVRPIKWSIEIRLGSLDWRTGSTHLVTRISHHIGYSNKYPDLYLHDIAMIHLLNKIKVTSNLSPIRLPAWNDTVPIGSSAIISGFGSNNIKEQTTESLMKMVLRIMPLDISRQWYPSHILQETQICTMPGLGFGCTVGDIGSPMTDKYQFHLLGIVSVPMTKCGIGGPDIYTKISSYIPYIREEFNYFTAPTERNDPHPGVNFPWATINFFD